MLGRGYQIHCKDFSGARAEALAGAVKTWVNDPQHPGRQLGWVELDSQEYVRPVRRLAIRFPKKRGVLQHALLISSLAPKEVISLLGLPIHLLHDPQAVILAYATL